jgi:hypothetical protein
MCLLTLGVTYVSAGYQKTQSNQKNTGGMSTQARQWRIGELLSLEQTRPNEMQPKGA